MEVRYRDLRGNNECAFHREHKLELDDELKTDFQLAAAKKKIVKAALDGAIKLEDVDQIVAESFKKISGIRSAEEERLKTMDAIQEIKRCVRSIWNQKSVMGQGYTINTNPTPMDITVNVQSDQLTVKGVRPDLVITYGNTTIAVNLRTGLPTNAEGKVIGCEDIEKDKQLYFLMLYAKQYAINNGAKTGDSINVTGAFWFMRKKSDNRSLSVGGTDGKQGSKAHFDQDMFYNDQMKLSSNIVTNPAHYTIGAADIAGADVRMEKVLPKYIEGYDKNECTKEQCDECAYEAICHYTHAPEALPVEEKEVDLSCVKLSPVQENVRTARQGFFVVNAGPGSGKTFVLVLRVCFLLLSGVKPEEILVIAFSRSAVVEYQNRINLIWDDIGTGADISGMKIVTFNELGNVVIQNEYQYFGYSRPPRVIQQIECFGIIEKILNTHDKIPDMDYRHFAMNQRNCKGPLAVASEVFFKMKQNKWTEHDAPAISKAVGEYFCSVDAATALAKLYNEYDKYLKERGLVEFVDQEVLLLDLLKKDPYYFDKYGFRHVLVDEAQDTSPAQFDILKYFTQGPSFESMMLVGDDSQSIYRFRDADPESFMKFEERMGLPKGTVKQLYMMDNFRSTPEILEFANKIIANNHERVDKAVIPSKKSGKPVIVKGFYNQDEELDYIVKEIQARIAAGAAHEDIAFIARNEPELLRMADRLTKAGIPSVLLNPEKFKENSRVKAGLALARCIANPNDTKDIMVCLNAIYDGNLFTLSDEAITAAIEERQKKYEEIRKMPENEQRTAFFEELALFDEDDEIYQSFVESLQNQPALDLVYQYCRDFELYGDDEKKRREHDYPGVVITTAHSSKGMEWPIVFNSVTKYDNKDLGTEKDPHSKDAEEARRLLFVSATRAKEELIVTGCFVMYGAEKKLHYNIFIKEALKACGEKYDREAISRHIAEDKIKAKAERDAKKKAEQEKIAQAAQEALKKNAEANAKEGAAAQ